MIYYCFFTNILSLGRVHSSLDLTEEEWVNICNTNVKGTWLVSKYVCIRMCNSNQGGSVINISSTARLNRGQLPGCLAYASSKTATNAVTKVQVWRFLVIFLGLKLRLSCFTMFQDILHSLQLTGIDNTLCRCTNRLLLDTSSHAC